MYCITAYLQIPLKDRFREQKLLITCRLPVFAFFMWCFCHFIHLWIVILSPIEDLVVNFEVDGIC